MRVLTVYKIDFLDQSSSLYFAQGGKAGQNDGPKQKARLYFPVKLAAKGHSLYVAEHLVEPRELFVWSVH